MLLTIQFPIADARPFVPDLNLRLPLPDWPEPGTSIGQTQFVHHFGKATERIREPDAAWPDETAYCYAKRGLRFVRLETQHAGFPGRRLRPRCAFRRLFCDGQAVVRVEIGIVPEPRADKKIFLQIEEILSVIRSMTELPTTVPRMSKTVKPQKLILQGKYLAGLYAHASMSESVDHSLGQLLVEAGTPLVLVELDNDEAELDFDDPAAKGFNRLGDDSINGAKALFCHLNTPPGIIKTWILQKGRATEGHLRNLRLCLGRLHAEQEALDIILKQIHRKRLINPPTEEAVNLLDRYFNSRLKVIYREKWAGMNQSEILVAFDATQKVIRSASRSLLISRYEGCRRQVWKKIARFQDERKATKILETINIEKGGITVERNVNVNGTGNIVNVAEYMSNVKNEVTNNLAKSEADPEVKSLITELMKEFEKIAAQAKPEQTKKIAKNLDALTNEIASDQPERSWYELSLKGIKEAAQAIGEIADPVISIVAKLSLLLLG